MPPAGVESYFAAWQELIAGVEQLKPEYFSGGLYYVEAFMKYGCFGVMIKSELPEEEKKILSRFAIEFERAYTRFLDLQKAEAQAREAQIEAALERVSSRAMAMQKSDELRQIIQLIYEQFIHLGIKIDSAGFAMDYMESDDFNFWFADSYSTFPNKVHIPYLDHPQFNRFKEAKEKGLDFYASNLTFEEKNKFFDHVSKRRSSNSTGNKRNVLQCSRLHIISCCFEEYSSLYPELYRHPFLRCGECNTYALWQSVRTSLYPF